VSESQARAISHFEARNEELVEEAGQLAAKVDALTAEVRELRTLDKPLHVFWPVRKEDVVAADWHRPSRLPQRPRHEPPHTLNWVMTPVGQASGGHVDVFRTIAYLEQRGHRSRVYFYDPLHTVGFDEIKATMQSYPAIDAELQYNALAMEPCDAVFATSWPTAYPVLNLGGNAKKFYYVQDYEPYFEPVGTYSVLAADTYRFGLHGLTLGDWLAEKLSSEYGMTCEPFGFGVDSSSYELRNRQPRQRVLFYAKPTSHRRGFELGTLALEQFHERHPDYEIDLLGADVDRYELSFPCNRHGVLSVEALCDLYNRCAAGLVLSFTNMSLLPLEMLACGCIPVSNDAPHTRRAQYAEQLRYAEATPLALADALYAAARDGEYAATVERAAEYARQFDWEASNRRIEQVLLRELGGAAG
jgi:glycosyltransferase involved in cell wall biosynthesis